MTEVEPGASKVDGRFWERRAMRAHINNEPELRGRAAAAITPSSAPLPRPLAKTSASPETA